MPLRHEVESGPGRIVPPEAPAEAVVGLAEARSAVGSDGARADETGSVGKTLLHVRVLSQTGSPVLDGVLEVRSTPRIRIDTSEAVGVFRAPIAGPVTVVELPASEKEARISYFGDSYEPISVLVARVRRVDKRFAEPHEIVERDVELRLATTGSECHVFGQVRMSDGGPLPEDLRIEVHDYSGKQNVRTTLTASIDRTRGRYGVVLLSDQSENLFVTSNGILPSCVPLDPALLRHARYELDLVCTAGKPFEIHVVDGRYPARAPLPGVQLHCEIDSLTSPRSDMFTAVTDGTGHSLLRRVPDRGVFRLKVSGTDGTETHAKLPQHSRVWDERHWTIEHPTSEASKVTLWGEMSNVRALAPASPNEDPKVELAIVDVDGGKRKGSLRERDGRWTSTLAPGEGFRAWVAQGDTVISNVVEGTAAKSLEVSPIVFSPAELPLANLLLEDLPLGARFEFTVDSPSGRLAREVEPALSASSKPMSFPLRDDASVVIHLKMDDGVGVLCKLAAKDLPRIQRVSFRASRPARIRTQGLAGASAPKLSIALNNLDALDGAALIDAFSPLDESGLSMPLPVPEAKYLLTAVSPEPSYLILGVVDAGLGMRDQAIELDWAPSSELLVPAANWNEQSTLEIYEVDGHSILTRTLPQQRRFAVARLRTQPLRIPKSAKYTIGGP